MWDRPGRGIKPLSLALQNRFLTTGLPGKPLFSYFLFQLFSVTVGTQVVLCVTSESSNFVEFITFNSFGGIFRVYRM